MKTPRKKHTPNISKLDNRTHLNLHAAGWDIGARAIYACVPADQDEPSVRVFQTVTVALSALADGLAAWGGTTVAMESTGIYGIPVSEIWEARGFAGHLIKARPLQHGPGRKTDVLDCPWLHQLQTYGLLRGSLRPDEDRGALRAYIRHRDTLLRYRSAPVQPLQNALHLMTVQWTTVISDITGVTGLQIIRAMVQGARDPHTRAAYRDAHGAKSEEAMAHAWTGHDRPAHLLALKQALAWHDFYNPQSTACDQESAQKYAACTPQVDLTDHPWPPRQRRRNTPQGNAPTVDLRRDLYQMAGVDLPQVDGLQVLTVQTIVPEIGWERHRWPTVKPCTSGLGLAPYQDISGGKALRTGPKKPTHRAATAFRLAAPSLHARDSALGGVERRRRSKHGAPNAIVATAHQLARRVSHLRTSREDAVEPGAASYEAKYRDRTIRNLQRQARQLGLDLVPVTAPPSDGAPRRRGGTLWGMSRPVPSLRPRSSSSAPHTRWPISRRLFNGQFPAPHCLSPTSPLVEFLSRGGSGTGHTPLVFFHNGPHTTHRLDWVGTLFPYEGTSGR